MRDVRITRFLVTMRALLVRNFCRSLASKVHWQQARKILHKLYPSRKSTRRQNTFCAFLSSMKMKVVVLLSSLFTSGKALPAKVLPRACSFPGNLSTNPWGTFPPVRSAINESVLPTVQGGEKLLVPVELISRPASVNQSTRTVRARRDNSTRKYRKRNDTGEGYVSQPKFPNMPASQQPLRSSLEDPSE